MRNLEKHIPLSLNIRRKLKTYTLVEFLRKEAKSVDKHEFIDGHILKMPYADGTHNIISSNVLGAVGLALEDLKKNHILFSSGQKVYFPSLDEVIYADALAACEKPLYWDDEQLLLINPILVVEVLSKSTQKYDRAGKFDKYKTLESIKEYVLIRQDQPYVETWYREKPGLWKETITTDLSASAPLLSVGIDVSLQRIYKNVNL